MWRSRPLGNLRRSESGAIAIEFAMVAPVLIVLLIGIICYGGYFWLAHSVQQMANDGARAAMGGLDDAERRSLANASMAAAIHQYAYLNPSAATLTVTTVGQQIQIHVAYDASSSVFWSMGHLLPMPSSTIDRQAVVLLGGY